MDDRRIVIISNVLWKLVFTLCLFQRPLDTFFPEMRIFDYIDDLLALFFLLYIVGGLLYKPQMFRGMVKVMVCMGLVFLIGTLCTYLSNINQPLTAQILDIEFLLKVFVCFVGGVTYFSHRSEKDNADILRSLTRVVKFIILASVVALPLAYAGVDWLYRGERYGLRSYSFIYSSPGMLSQYCIGFFVIMVSSMALNKRVTFSHKLFICALLLVWMMSLRSRAFVIVMIFLALLIVMKCQGMYLTPRQRLRKMLSLKLIIPLALLSLYVGYAQVVNYYTNEDKSRAMLLAGGIETFKDYFPWGAGWATYGTKPAQTYYSPLYEKYGFSKNWALGEEGGEATDNYWPAVMAELGLFGVVVVAVLIFFMSKIMLTKSLFDKWVMVAMLCYVIFLLISSTATCCYSSPTTTMFIAITGLILNCRNRNGSSSIVRSGNTLPELGRQDNFLFGKEGDSPSSSQSLRD